MDSIRINKYLADHGYASRREADKLIADGKVLINGRVAKLGELVKPGDEVTVPKLHAPHYLYFAYHKPRGEETKERYQTNLFPIGRLDKDSEGLLLVTNDGRLTTKLIGTETKTEKEYLVTVDKKIAGIDLKRMNEGVEIEGHQTKPAQTTRINETMFKIILTEGKKHQIRRMCAALGYQVQELKRVRVADIKLGNLKPGNFRPLTGFNLNQSRNEA